MINCGELQELHKRKQNQLQIKQKLITNQTRKCHFYYYYNHYSNVSITTVQLLLHSTLDMKIYKFSVSLKGYFPTQLTGKKDETCNPVVGIPDQFFKASPSSGDCRDPSVALTGT